MVTVCHGHFLSGETLQRAGANLTVRTLPNLSSLVAKVFRDYYRKWESRLTRSLSIVGRIHLEP